MFAHSPKMIDIEIVIEWEQLIHFINLKFEWFGCKIELYVDLCNWALDVIGMETHRDTYMKHGR